MAFFIKGMVCCWSHLKAAQPSLKENCVEDLVLIRPPFSDIKAPLRAANNIYSLSGQEGIQQLSQLRIGEGKKPPEILTYSHNPYGTGGRVHKARVSKIGLQRFSPSTPFLRAHRVCISLDGNKTGHFMCILPSPGGIKCISYAKADFFAAIKLTYGEREGFRPESCVNINIL